MSTLKAIVLQWDGAADQTIPIGAPQTSVPTFINPEGVDLVHAKPLAPTPAEFSANPGRYDSEPAHDMLRNQPPAAWYDELKPDEENPGQTGAYEYTTALTPSNTWSAWFKKNREQARRAWKSEVKYDLNEAMLGPLQKKRMGIT